MIEPSDNLIVHLIGPSGSGKTSIINIIANHQFSNVEESGLNKLLAIIPTKFTRDVFGDFYAPEENEIDNPNVSKTNKCTPYSFPNGFTFVDSPPIGDTRKEREKINTQTVIESFIDLKSVNCVLIVLNGTTPRLTYEIKDSFRRILESFPNSMVNNFVFLFTHCYQETSNFDIKELGAEKLIKPNQENIFYMKNPFFSQHPDTWSENEIGKLKREWVFCMETLDDIFSYIKTLPRILTLDFKTVNDSKDSVFTSLDNVFSQLPIYDKWFPFPFCNPNIHYKTKELQTQPQVQSQQHPIKNNESFCYQGKQTYEKSPQIDYSMNCNDKINQQNQSYYFTQNPIETSQHGQIRNQDQIMQPTLSHTINPYLKHSNQTEIQIKERLKEIEIQKNKLSNEIFDLILEEKTLNSKLLDNQKTRKTNFILF
ncbi:hypothetical protein ACTFIY_005017 [Dictyostelium cf. discoideum]